MSDGDRKSRQMRAVADPLGHRMRGKDSIAWDLVNKHETELTHLSGRVDSLEKQTGATAKDVTKIRETQIADSAKLDRISDKLTEAATNAKHNDGKKDALHRNLIAFAALCVALVAMLLNNCGR